MDTLGGTLTIKEAQYVDAGDYICVAVNAAGSSSGKISLDVGGECLSMTQPKVSFSYPETKLGWPWPQSCQYFKYFIIFKQQLLLLTCANSI